MKSTPIICLQHTYNELLAYLRHVQICLNYRAHLLTFNSHPNSIVISDTWYDWFPNINNYESFNLQTNKFSADFLEQNSLPNNVFTNYLTNLSLPPWTFEPMLTDFYFLSVIFDKANTAANKQIFLEYVVNNYKDYLHICTDDSKTQYGTSAAFYVDRFDVKHNHCFIFSAELYAILKFLYRLSSKRSGKTLILIDNICSLQVFKNLSYGKNRLVIKIIMLYSILVKSGLEITFLWIPSHSGIHGNEIADQLAKLAITSTLSNSISANTATEQANLQISTSEIKK